MRIVAIIPVRFGSSRFPGKPLALISGRPMVEHVYRKTAACGELSEVVAATDDERIFACVKGFDGKAVMTLSSHASGTDRIAEAAEILGLDDKDIVVNVQGDQPLVPPEALAKMILPLLRDESLPMCTLMIRIRDPRETTNPNHVKVVTDARGLALYFSRHPIPFYRDAGKDDHVHFKHLGLYAYRAAFLRTFTRLPQGRLEIAEKLEQLRALEHGYSIRVVETAHDSPEVDTPEDVDIIESIMTGTRSHG
ncbi:MAG: 3-deoxy-manno-octulosonate cytidylyltransferase [Thermodesulfobacteriota bacterium]